MYYGAKSTFLIDTHNYSVGRRAFNAEEAGVRGGRGVELEKLNLEFLGLLSTSRTPRSPRPPRAPLLRVEIDFVATIQGFDLTINFDPPIRDFSLSPPAVPACQNSHR